MDAVGSFFAGQMLSYAGEAGSLKAKLEILKEKLASALANADALHALNKKITEGLIEAAPDHEFAAKERRIEEFDRVYAESLKKRKQWVRSLRL